LVEKVLEVLKASDFGVNSEPWLRQSVIRCKIECLQQLEA